MMAANVLTKHVSQHVNLKTAMLKFGIDIGWRRMSCRNTGQAAWKATVALIWDDNYISKHDYKKNSSIKRRHAQKAQYLIFKSSRLQMRRQRQSAMKLHSIALSNTNESKSDTHAALPLEEKKPFIIGVAGGTASGKTCLCKKIVEELAKGEEKFIISRINNDTETSTASAAASSKP